MNENRLHMYPDLQSKSASLYKLACEVMPGGNTRNTMFTSPYPIYSARGAGSRIYDVDGVERIDFLNNYSSLIHGHAHPEIVKAARDQLEIGTCYAFPTEFEIKLAQLLCNRIPSAEHIRFTNSGTEAVMMALKAARAFTSRPKIAKFEGGFHGAYDLAEVSVYSNPGNWGETVPSNIPGSAGTPKSILDEAVILPFNDVSTARSILLSQAKEIAAIMIDPMPAYVAMIPANQEYLTMLRQVADEFGIVLISDEVVVFRLGYNGAQGVFNFQADLTLLGKIIGGGFPVGAICGRADIMSVFDPTKGMARVPHGGTFNANPMAMSAGLTTMELMTPSAYEQINKMGDYCRHELNSLFKRHNLSAQITGLGSLLRIHLHSNPILNYRTSYISPSLLSKFHQLYRNALNNGIVIGPAGLAVMSTAMTSADADKFIEVIYNSVKEIK